MNVFRIEDLEIQNNKKVVCKYKIEGEWKKYFSNIRESFIEYSVSIKGTPKAILAIPFICNILPLAWLVDATIFVDELDSDFYMHLDDIKNGYAEMYPMLQFKGNIVTELISNDTNITNKCACFFSGGVDAYTTLLRHVSEKPYLMTIRGADIKLDDIEGWNKVWEHSIMVGKEYGVEPIAITTDFRDVLLEGELYLLVQKTGDGWWHGFQSGIGIISHAAPLAYSLNLRKVYIGSSFPEYMKGQYTCASDPSIDNHVYMGKCQTIHDGYELDRQDKIRYLIKRKKELGKKISLRVCWESTGGKNCCHCEKCYRTVLEIVSEGADPNEYGFEWTSNNIKQCKYDMERIIEQPMFNVNQYYPIIKTRMLQNKDIIKNFPEYEWITCFDFSRFNDTPWKKWRRTFFFRGYRKIMRDFLGRRIR